MTISHTPTVTEHLTITPSILYFGTPVALLSTENDDGSANLAPISSAWALGQVVVPGTNHVDPAAWHPLIYNFRHYFGLGAELGHSFRSETPTG
ncbi:hypothetical protein [Micromonospora sp. U21]|uniref:hypothetical protein n=1 Tax=Micromonospora sp. U21 TaxID=2824899 RepID=UPI001B394AC1|nr:hypothetical protein [Micromonospora sp. U21]MBQ0901029.1 hypothetical protein [Micromonospora sp. U21]